MSTTFGIPREPINIELGDEDGVYYYINTEIFEKVFFLNLPNHFLSTVKINFVLQFKNSLLKHKSFSLGKPPTWLNNPSPRQATNTPL